MGQAAPLRERSYDVFFLVCFSAMLLLCVLSDLPTGLGIVDPDESVLAVWNAWYAGGGADALVLEAPYYMRPLALSSAFAWGTFYVFAIYAIARGRSWIRNWCFLYAGGLLANMFNFFYMQALGPEPPAS